VFTRARKSDAPYNILQHAGLLGWAAKLEGLWMLIKYIHRYPPYQMAVPSIRNLRVRRAVVTETQLTWDLNLLAIKLFLPYDFNGNVWWYA
jgi:hypothetical protein